MHKTLYISIFFFAGLLISSSATAQQASDVFIKDASGKTYPLSAYDSLSKVETIMLIPVKTSGVIEGYIIKPIAQTLIPFVPDDKKYNILEIAVTDNPTLKIGQKMPAFKLNDMNGKVYIKDSLKGKVIVMNFWFKACGPCKQEMPYLNGLADYYKDNREVAFIGASTDDSVVCEAFLQKNIFKYHIVPKCRDLADKWNIHSFPINIVIDKQGKIALYTEGYNFGIENYLNEAIKQALAN